MHKQFFVLFPSAGMDFSSGKTRPLISIGISLKKRFTPRPIYIKDLNIGIAL